MASIEGSAKRSMLTPLLLSFLLVVTTLLVTVGNHAWARVNDPPTNPGDVVINEVAWIGTQASADDEWIELYNTTDQAIDLAGWTLEAEDGTPSISLSETIPAKGYFLLERTDDSTVSDITADQIYSGALSNSGEALFLKDPSGDIIDSANSDGGGWPAGANPSGNPAGRATMERIDPTRPDSDANWATNNGITCNGKDAGDNPINGTPKSANSTTIPTPTPTITPTFTPTPTLTPTPTATPTTTPVHLLISEVCYDGAISGEGDEFVEILNPTADTVSLAGYKIGDEETQGGREGMYSFPADASIGPGKVLVLAKSAEKFRERFGSNPDLELADLPKYTAWASGSWALSNDGDEVLLLGPGDQLVDAIAYKSGNYDAVGVTGHISAPAPRSLQRVEDWDSDKMRADFAIAEPNPGQRTLMPTPPPVPPSPSFDGMHAYFGCLHSHSTYSDGSGPPRYASAVGRANELHFLALTDHSHMCNDEEWVDILARAEEATVDGTFVGLRGFEWTHKTIGHLTALGTQSYTSRDDSNYDTLEEFYAWLAGQEEAVVAQFNHPFYDCHFDDFAYDAAADEKIIALEVGNGSDPYYTFEEAYLRALYAGWHIGPANNGDTETPDWGADTPHRTGVLAPNLTKSDLLQALRARRVFATEDANCALALRAGDAWMGSTVGASTLNFQIYYHDAEGEGATLELFDRSLLVASTTTSGSSPWSVTVPAAPGHYYFAKAIQEDGDIAYTSPIWVEGTAMPEELLVNEVLPALATWIGTGTAWPTTTMSGLSSTIPAKRQWVSAAGNWMTKPMAAAPPTPSLWGRPSNRVASSCSSRRTPASRLTTVATGCASCAPMAAQPTNSTTPAAQATTKAGAEPNPVIGPIPTLPLRGERTNPLPSLSHPLLPPPLPRSSLPSPGSRRWPRGQRSSWRGK